jgi:hypothetical protein
VKLIARAVGGKWGTHGKHMSRTATAARGGAAAGQRQRQRREVRVRCEAKPPPLPRSALRRNRLGGSELVVSEVGKRPPVHVA